MLCQGIESIMIASSLYVPSQKEMSSSELSSDSRSSANLSLRRTKLNEFLAISGKSILTQQRKPWANMLGRTRHVYVTKARDAVVAALEVIIPDDAGGLWEALKDSGEVDSALDVLSESHPADDKYLKSLAEAYQNASSWDTRRQVLSVMADLVPYSLIQRYLPGIKKYRVKTAREHGKNMGVALLCSCPRVLACV